LPVIACAITTAIQGLAGSPCLPNQPSPVSGIPSGRFCADVGAALSHIPPAEHAGFLSAATAAVLTDLKVGTLADYYKQQGEGTRLQLLFAYSDSTEGRIQRADLLVRQVVRVQHLPGLFVSVNVTSVSPGPPAGCTRVVFSVSDSMAQLTNQGFTAAVL
jgi:hypothetical protein